MAEEQGFKKQGNKFQTSPVTMKGFVLKVVEIIPFFLRASVTSHHSASHSLSAPLSCHFEASPALKAAPAFPTLGSLPVALTRGD